MEMKGIIFDGTTLTIEKRAYSMLISEIYDIDENDDGDRVLDDSFGILKGWKNLNESWTGSPRHDSDTTTRRVTFISPDDVVYVGEYESNLMCGDPFHDVTLTPQ